MATRAQRIAYIGEKISALESELAAGGIAPGKAKALQDRLDELQERRQALRLRSVLQDFETRIRALENL